MEDIQQLEEKLKNVKLEMEHLGGRYKDIEDNVRELEAELITLQDNKTQKAPIPLAPNAASVIKDYRSLTPKERVAVFQTLFSLGNYGEAIDNKLILISLIGSITLAMKKKNPEADPYMAIDKLVDLKALNNGITEEYKEILALYVGEFLGGVKTGNTFGIKSAADIKTKINEILQQYIPF